MFNRILEYFKGEVTSLDVDIKGQATDRELQIAVAVLLLHVAGTDEDYAPEEVKTAYQVLEQQFEVTDNDAHEILTRADAIRNEKGKIDDFVAAINANFSIKQRQLIFALVWKIIAADEKVEKRELRMSTQIRTRLQLSREQAEAAKDLLLKGKV